MRLCFFYYSEYLTLGHDLLSINGSNSVGLVPYTEVNRTKYRVVGIIGSLIPQRLSALFYMILPLAEIFFSSQLPKMAGLQTPNQIEFALDTAVVLPLCPSIPE